MTEQALLKTLDKGSLHLKNRVVMAPLTRSRADNPGLVPTDLMAEYYGQRATAGLIITEATIISFHGRGFINTPGIYSAEQVEGWKKITRAVHDRGGKIFCQLWHVGRVSHPDLLNGELPVAPSALIEQGVTGFTNEGPKQAPVPRALLLAEIPALIAEYVKAARNAIEAGFDGVEVHGANGYLLNQFFARNANHRTDEYGGSPTNRARILFEILDAIKKVVPLNKVGLRLSPFLNGLGIQVDEETIPTFDHIVTKLNEYRLAYLHVMRPWGGKPAPELPDVPTHFRGLYKGVLMVNAGFDQAQGNQVIADGKADLVAYGQFYISNPDLPERFARHLPLAKADHKTFYVPGAHGYTDYPAAT